MLKSVHESFNVNFWNTRSFGLSVTRILHIIQLPCFLLKKKKHTMKLQRYQETCPQRIKENTEFHKGIIAADRERGERLRS